MMKIYILLLGILLSVTALIAQERKFKNFDIKKGNKQYFIVKPKTYDSLLHSLKIDTLFSLGIKFDDFSTMDSYMKQLRDWKKELLARVIPKEVQNGVQHIMNEASLPPYVADHHLYINLLVDSTGNILSVYFKTSIDVLKAMTEEQLQYMYDAFTNTKMDADILKATGMKQYYTKKQFYRACEYKSENIDLSKMNLDTFPRIFKLLGIKPMELDYALLEVMVGDIMEVQKYRMEMNPKKQN